MIKVKDVVLHKLSGLYFICENAKMEKWMNMNPYYEIYNGILTQSYFKKNK